MKLGELYRFRSPYQIDWEATEAAASQMLRRAGRRPSERALALADLMQTLRRLARYSGTRQLYDLWREFRG